MATSKMAPPKGGGGSGTGGGTGGVTVPPGGLPDSGGNLGTGSGTGSVTLGGEGSATASAAGLLHGAGEIVEADPRDAGGFDLIARLFRDTGKNTRDISNIKQRI